MAERDGIAIGDTVQVDALGGTADYLVVGLMQTGRNLGSWAQVTTDGFHRLAPGQQLPSIAVEVPESADAGVVAKAISERFGAQLRMSSDTRSAVAAQMDVYLRLGNLLGWAILGLGAVVIALVVGMVATTTIVRDRRDYGVQRALGFTSGQLIRQNVYWFTPIVTLGAAAGAWVGQVTAGPLLSLMLQGIGVSKLSLSLPSGLVPLLVAGILGYALAVTALAALRIRRYTAQRLLTS